MKRKPSGKEGDVNMMMDYITLAGLMLAIFVSGIAVGKLVEKIERLIREKENEEHKDRQNDRR